MNPLQSRTGDLPLTAWLLAAADCYQAMREPRAYREPLTEAEAAGELCREMESGRLAPEAANAVLVAAGQPGRPVTRPAGLSERECQVLRLLSRGLATKQIARQHLEESAWRDLAELGGIAADENLHVGDVRLG